MTDDTIRVSTQDTFACREFARDNWSLKEAELIHDTGMFLYLQDIMVVDGPIWEAPLLSSFDHLNPMSTKTREWWQKARAQCHIDRKLTNEMRVFCDPLRARDASEQDKMAAQIHSKRKWDDSDQVESRSKKPRRPLDEEETAEQPAPISFTAQSAKETQIILKGLGPSGASIVWRINNWRPFFFILMESHDLSPEQIDMLRRALAETGKLEDHTSIHCERVLAPRLIPFAYDPANPKAPKKLLWYKMSFPTIDAKKRAARFLSKTDNWTIHPHLFRFPWHFKHHGFTLAEHVIDDAKLFMKTTQININQWLTIAHDATRQLCVRQPDDTRASIAQFEWIIPSASLLGLFESNSVLASEEKDLQLDSFVR